MQTFGIDISKWQGDFNFNAAVKEGVKFVVIKAGGADGGLYTDPKFVRNYDEAKKRNIPVGVYWFSDARNNADSVKEAEYLYNNILKGRQFELPVYLDVENKAQLAIGKAATTAVIHAWCQWLEAKGYYVGIYSSRSYFNSYMNDNELQRYSHWIAEWSTSTSYPYPEVMGMWQFGGEKNLIRTNKVAGVTCDQDYMLVDFPAIIKSLGLNGFSKSTTYAPVPTPAPVVITRMFNGFNNQRLADDLKIYTTEFGSKTTNTNPWGCEVMVDRWGAVMNNPVWGMCNKTIPRNGWVISGHGKSSKWILENIKKGMQVSFNSNTMLLTVIK